MVDITYNDMVNGSQPVDDQHQLPVRTGSIQDDIHTHQHINIDYADDT
ncbi:MAG: hypothetical protein ACYC1M_15665 [Armatimonadota bacterium]